MTRNIPEIVDIWPNSRDFSKSYFRQNTETQKSANMIQNPLEMVDILSFQRDFQQIVFCQNTETRKSANMTRNPLEIVDILLISCDFSVNRVLKGISEFSGLYIFLIISDFFVTERIQDPAEQLVLSPKH